ncbi:SDR family oxidoreductase [Skermanella mucosa]|uniref:SDR family NAD(P)-dependent oxidoreductase n=1 Tax=Skermanella mucosa TaxID=1789672 RepID=UPI00192AE36C|nr:SDR family oxidoreductase [Skermanella mucosa]UEM20522.1 SDR family oxidoreductase [Skermanella mucosa]
MNSSGPVPSPRTVLVTGGGRGIGAAVVRLFAARGWRVALTWVSDRAAAEGVAASAVGSAAFRCDVRDEEQVVGLFRDVVGAFGRIDALVNNAGITGPPRRIEDVTAGLLRDVATTNLIGPILCAREAVRHMRASAERGAGGGAIVNLSSTATKRGSPGQWIDYAATKGAIDVFTVGLAAEVAPFGIRVNAVAPGLTLSDPADAERIAARLETMRHEIPMGRAGMAEEVAEAVFWLCSDAASHVSGAVLPVAGGR